MKRKPNNVLRSRTGASITFALLLFLVCAVVGALVLTAGSAAAGRVSNLAKSDQRYYSVSSAAGLLAQELSGKTVKIVQERAVTTDVTTSYKVDLGSTGSVVTPVGESTTTREASYKTKVNDFLITNDLSSYDPNHDVEGKALSAEAQASFLNARTAILLFGKDGGEILCCNDRAMRASMKNGSEQSGELALYHSISVADDEEDDDVDDQLTVTGKYYVQSDGTMIFTLTNEGDANERYSLRITLTPTINETQSDKTTEDTSRSYTDNGYTETVTTVTTTVKTSEITWAVSSVEKVVS